MLKRIKLFFGILGAVFLMAFFTAPAVGVDSDAIAVIDFQKILETSSAGKAAQAKINAEGKKMEKDLKEKGDEIKDLEKKLELERMVLSKEAREEKQREVRIKINDFKSLQAKYRSDIKKLETKVIDKMQEDVFNLVDEIAKKNSYLLILEKRAGGVIYAKKTMDITAQVIEQYDKKVASETKPKTE